MEILLQISQTETAKTSGCLLQIAQKEVAKVSGCLLPIRQIERNREHQYRIDNQTVIEPFDILVFIGGVEIPQNKIQGQLRIIAAVNQAKTAELTICADCDKNKQIDLYKYAGKPIEIFYSSPSNYRLIYKGLVSIQKIDVYNKLFNLTATDEKLNKINNLSDETINAIRVYPEQLTTEELTKEQRFSKIMESVAADYYFDNYGRFVLTEWQPKSVADLYIQNCKITNDSFQYSVLNIGQIVNKIKVLFQFNYYRKVQRDLTMGYDSGLYGTRFNEFLRFIGEHKFIPVPPVNSVITAANSAGWTVGNFRYSTIPSLAGTGVVIYNKDDYAMYASWTASKRFMQNIQENNTVILQNQQSIDFFGEKSEELTFGMKIKAEDENWSSNYPCYLAPQGVQASNGDWIIDLSQTEAQDYQNAIQFALSVAQTKILHSHFQNECSFDYYFRPDLTLSDTIGVKTPMFDGNIKMQEYQHIIDFDKQTADSKIRGKWFKGFSGSPITVPPRPPVPVSQRADSQLFFGNRIVKEYSNPLLSSNSTVGNLTQPADYCIAKDGLDNLYGYVMKEFILNSVVEATVGKVSAIKFAVKTPDIEEEMTNGLTVESENIENIAIPNTSILSWLPCSVGE